jgi:hypothetical protein
MMRTRDLLAGLLVLVLAGCASGASPTPSVAPSAAPSPQPSQASDPSEAPTPTPPPLDVKVTFDGETCTYLGPTAVPEGTLLRIEYAPDQGIGASDLLVYGVQPDVTYQMLLDHIAATGPTDVGENIPDWVIQETASVINGAGTLLYTIVTTKPGNDGEDHRVGGYQILCNTPTVHPAAQVSVAS